MTKPATLGVAGLLAIVALTITAMAAVLQAAAQETRTAVNQRHQQTRACVTGAYFTIGNITYTCDPQGTRP